MRSDASRPAPRADRARRPFAAQGTLTPLLGIGVCVSIQFGALEYTKRYFAQQNVLKGRGGSDGMTLGSGQLFTAGVFAGLANGVVSGPVEHIRIRAPPSLLSTSTGLLTMRARISRIADTVGDEPGVRGAV